MKTQKNIFLVGPMGAGKTSIGKALARELERDFYDIDQVVEERTGAALLWIYDLEGEEGFRERESKILAELVLLQNIVLATGGGTIALSQNRNLLANNGIVIYLKTEFDDQVRRVRFCKKRPLTREPSARRDELLDLTQQLEPWYLELADIVYQTTNKPAKRIITELKKLLVNFL